MEIVVFSGLQGAGKSTFFARRYANTHLRLSLDVLGTRHREAVMLHAAVAVGQSVVVDNTNPSSASRRRYAALARAVGAQATLVLFHIAPELALRRNAQREGKARVPDLAVLGTANKLEPASFDEGFSRIVDVYVTEDDSVEEERSND